MPLPMSGGSGPGIRVWIANLAYSGSRIYEWVPGNDVYERAAVTAQLVRQVYAAELQRHLCRRKSAYVLDAGGAGQSDNTGSGLPTVLPEHVSGFYSACSGGKMWRIVLSPEAAAGTHNHTG